ncbi:unnamed protein product [Phytophthora fragariaefolia]|uniref:Unnamed protein product n=1 Tax=Phytophthora fragariaefolia TaxID=1490495 RepID=A0A9W6WR73_9STRA|nr:unnamed protein product [Phytophthora fragariaefolia]
MAPVVDLAPVGAEPNSLRSALGILSTALERTGAYEALRADHAALQDAYLASTHRVEALEAELRGAAEAAPPFVRFFQQRYDILRNTLATMRTSLADCQNALAERLDNAREISEARERLALQQRVHEDAVKDFHDEIDQLEFQVAALKSSIVAASTHSSRSIQLLEAEVAKGRADRETMAVELQQSCDTNRVLEASQLALESSVSKLCRQVDALERRAGGLRDVRDRQRDLLQARLQRTEAARDWLRDEVDCLTAKLSTATDEMHRAVASRNQVATVLSARNDPPAESSENEVLAVLARTRSAQRRRDRADSRGSTPSRLIAIDDSGESDSADRTELTGPASVPASTPAIPTSANGRSRACAARGRDPSEGNPGGEKITCGEPNNSGAGHNQLVSDAALASLPVTRIPRDRLLPGYRARRQYQASEVAPWPLSDVLACSALEMPVDSFFRRFSCPLGWLYPRRSQTSTPSQTTWFDSVVTGGNLTALLSRQPCEALNSPIVPMSFDMMGEFEALVTAHIAFEDEHRPTYWKSTHVMPISPAMREATPALAQYYTAR